MLQPETIRPHRQWPAPTTPWAIGMTWEKLLFMHWPVPHEVLRPHVPHGLQLETYDDQAWIGIVPFEMRRTRSRMLPAVPRISTFPELNVRTYVNFGRKPGVYFFSLDAASRLAVWGARWIYSLNYYLAEMSIRRRAGKINYSSHRRHPNAPPANFRANYWPVGNPFEAEPGSLEDWLTARYCLYSVDRRGRIYRLEIDHEPWLLQRAEAEIYENTMTGPLGIELPQVPPRLHYSARLAVVSWPAVPVQ